MRLPTYATIIVLALFLGIALEVLSIINSGGDPFAFIDRLLIGALIWAALIAIGGGVSAFLFKRIG
jgi:hypothetical protein